MLRPGVAHHLATLAYAVIACAPEPVAGDAGVANGAAAVASERAPAGIPRVWLALGGETFTLELAADPDTRYRGLSGRTHIDRNGGMLFVYPDEAPRGMVMRECFVPIDVAFLDASGTIVALWAMSVEPPRAANEPRRAYERRLPIYRSGAPARFAIEVAGGRLARLGLVPGSKIALDVAALDALVR
jgi:uncharacterized membrane protein (UPF0127 family)